MEYLDLEEDNYAFLSVLFLNGVYYVYANILWNILNRGHIVHDATKGHCPLNIDGKYFNVNDEVNSNSCSFRKMTPDDHLYCINNYGFEEYEAEEMEIFVREKTYIYNKSF